MPLRNSSSRYGAVHILLHWVIAIAIFGLFGLGYYMVDLSYYDDLYRTAPHIHKSVGVLVLLAMLFRLVWKVMNSNPKALPTHQRWEVVAAHATHHLLYLLIFVALVSGYLISTADGSSIDVFNWFSVPSVTGQIKGMEDVAGDVHYWVTWALVILAAVHGLAALKHHILDKDETLRRMLGLSPRN